jgi:hypothetical protein
MTSAPSSAFVARRLGFAGLGAAFLGLAGWIALRNLTLPSNDGWIFWVPIASWLVTMGLLCWWSALDGRRGDSRARIRASWRAGWLVGGIALALGFLGPLALTPKASLGPLLGILLTGPVGFVLGAVIGALIQPKASSA